GRGPAPRGRGRHTGGRDGLRTPRGRGRGGAPPAGSAAGTNMAGAYRAVCLASCRTAEQRDELAPPHSITSSARASSVGGTSRPSAFAVLRLITNSILVGNSTGRSPGLVPFKILST